MNEWAGIYICVCVCGCIIVVFIIYSDYFHDLRVTSNRYYSKITLFLSVRLLLIIFNDHIVNVALLLQFYFHLKAKQQQLALVSLQLYHLYAPKTHKYRWCSIMDVLHVK